LDNYKTAAIACDHKNGEREYNPLRLKRFRHVFATIGNRHAGPSSILEIRFAYGKDMFRIFLKGV